MKLSTLNDDLRQHLEVQSVALLPDFPFRTYAEFLVAYEERRVRVFTGYVPTFVPAVGTAADRIMHYLLTSTPLVMPIVLIAFALKWSAFVLLLGIPIAIVAWGFSWERWLKGFGGSLLLVGLAVMTGAWWVGNWVIFLLAASYAVPNFCGSVARNQCDMLVREAIGKSELVLIWLYQSEKVVIQQPPRQASAV